ncbi:MAG: hypothetical protein NC097_03420 [Clostridium sp.]|nr:hypothetical protein [Prevotella sp.]MCM1428827.1 hypothetical protein [Clostridium sp.]MCM1475202.1 hypothetical protein [Muribaculaceae bacterium]
MKKLLLSLAVLATATSVSAAQWAVVGGYNNWSLETAKQMEEKETGIFQCTIESLSSGFKIVDVENNNWDIQYGAQSSSDLLVVNEPMQLKGKVDGIDPANIDFANMVTTVNNAVCVFNTNDYTLTINGDVVVAYPDLWITGSMYSWNAPGEGASVAMTQNDGIYIATIDFGDTPSEFKIVGRGWGPDFCAAEENNLLSLNEEVTLVRGGKNIKTNITGIHDVTFNINTLRIKVTGESAVELNVEENETPVYYNLQGVQVVNPQNGLYIVKRGNKVTKEFAK